MKKRKILYLFPLAALILSGCTFQEGWETVKGFMGDKVYEPAKTWVENLLGIKHEEKKEEKEDQQGGGQQGGGEHQGEGGGQQGGGGEEQTRNYGTENAPLSVSEALAIVEEECAEENALSKQAMVVEGVIYSAMKTYDYEEGPAFECYLGNDEEQIYIYRVHGAEADKPNFKEGSTLKFRGYAKNYKGTLEFCDNGSEKCTVLSLEKPQGTEAVTGIEFDEQVYELQVGQTKKVTASVLPLNAGNQNYTLSLDNVSPAGCVSLGADNVLTANAVGTAKMVATTEEGGFTAEIDVTVIAAINYGTLENPLTIAEAMEVINKESPTKQTVYVTGEVKSNKAYNTQYKNTEIWLTDGENDFELYGCSLPEGFTPAQPVENDPALVGKIVVAHGTAKKYNTTYELDKGCAIDTVSEPAPIVIESVTVTPSTLELEVGEQANISATVSPAKANQEVTWKVQNPENYEVANYQDGKIIAVAAGEATVVATSVADDKVSGLCSVVVTEATKTLQSISFAGEVTKTAYNEDEEYSAAGLKVMAHYDKGEDVDVTENATITLDKQVAALGDTKFTVTAKYSTADDITLDVNVTVAEVNQFVEAYNAALALTSGATEQYTFKGVIAAKRQDNEWFIQHEGYGIEYYGNNADFAVGKQVKVKATLQNYSGLPETKTIASGTVIGDGVMPTPVELASGADVEAAKLNVLANVTGTAKEDWSSYSAGSNTTLKLVGSDNKDIDVFFKKNLFSAKESTLKAVKAGDTVTFTNVVTSIYTTRQILFVAGSDVQVTPAPEKTIASVTSVTGPSEVALNGTISTSQVTVVVEYTDGSSGNATVTAVTCDTSAAGQVQADVTIDGWNETLHFTVTVTSSTPVATSTTYTFNNTYNAVTNLSNVTSAQFVEKCVSDNETIITGYTAQTNAYLGGNGGSGDTAYDILNCLKVGKSKAQGSITLSLDSTKAFTKIRVGALGARDDGTLTINNVTQNITNKASNTNTTPAYYEFTVSNTGSLVLSSKNATSNNYSIFIVSLEFIA